jgi:hypothetical protein
MSTNTDRVDVTNPAYIARRAQEFKIMTLALAMSVTTMMDPRLPVLHWTLDQAGVPRDGDIPMQLLHGDEPERLTYSTREVLTKMTKLQGDPVRDLLSISMLLAGTRLGHMINTGGHMRKDVPLLQFARHFRNACAHGDRWHFAAGEPRHPAALRDLVLTRDLQGQQATFVTVSPRRFVDFLDDFSNHFAPGSVPRPTRE